MLTEAQGRSLGALAEAAEQRLGDASTLWFEGTTWTLAELGRRGAALAGGLAGLGVGPGDRVAVCMSNCPEVLVTYRAAWRLGAVVTPLLFLLTVPELAHALRDSGARVVVTTADLEPKVRAAAGPDVPLVVVGEGFDALLAADPAPLAEVDPTGPAALLYTGGTTGRAKGVLMSHDALSSAAWASVSAGDEYGHDVSLLPLPLAHVFGLMVSTMSVHATRPSHSVLMRWFEPEGFLRLIGEHGVQTCAVVPTMLRVLLQAPLESADLRTLQRFACGSAPLPREVVDQWARRVPHVEIDEGYGCTETCASGTVNRFGAARAGSVGTASPGVEVRVVDPVSGDDVATGEDGEVLLRTPALMTGYRGDPEATAAALRDGWFHTGDIGHLDDDGYLYLVDRIKDVVIRGGFNVYPRDVEEVLIAHPAVVNAGVVGRPDETHGEEVVAFVQLAPGATVGPDELVAWARERLSAVKYPREVRVVETVPLTSVGKLDRKALRAQLS